MPAVLNRVFVVDVEATCWETREEQGDRPNEIIEIGICELIVRTGEIRDISSYVVRPKFTEISPFCTQLTGWKNEDVADASDALAAIAAIEHDYGMSKDHIWFSCGEYDRVKLGTRGRASLSMYGAQSGSSIFDKMRHVNVKTLFALKHKLNKELGMDRMLQRIGEKLDGRHHNGADDAANIAKIVRHVLS